MCTEYEATPETYFFVEAQSIEEEGTINRYAQIISTRKTKLFEQHEAIWSHVYKALRPCIGDQLIVTQIENFDSLESVD